MGQASITSAALFGSAVAVLAGQWPSRPVEARWLIAVPGVIFGLALASCGLGGLTAGALAPGLALNTLATGLVASTLFAANLGVKHPAVVAQVGRSLAALSLWAVVFVFAESSIWALVSFEAVLLAAINLLRLTSKSERVGEAATEMGLWALAGSAFLVVGFASSGLSSPALGSFDQLRAACPPQAVGLFFVIGFGVKVPIWPFASWLLKAHVEAAAEFSVLLSGFIVKLGVVGLARFVEASGSDLAAVALVAASAVAVVEALSRLFAQTDLKRVVALTTVVEMNWAMVCLALGGPAGAKLAGFVITAHSLTTAAEFFLVEALARRYGSRDCWRIGGLGLAYPNLWRVSVATTLVTIGLPGSSLFFAKLVFFGAAAQVSGVLFVFFLAALGVALPLFFVRLWAPIWFGSAPGTRSATAPDLSTRELISILGPTAAGVVLGLAPGLAWF